MLLQLSRDPRSALGDRRKKKQKNNSKMKKKREKGPRRTKERSVDGEGGRKRTRGNLQWEEKEIKMQADTKGKRQPEWSGERGDGGRGLTARKKMMFSLEQIM